MKSLRIRVDGNEIIGLGHVIRCISLAHMLKNDFNVFFYLFRPDERVRNYITDAGFASARVDSEGDFINMLTEADVVVLDGYKFNSQYQEKVKEKGCLLAFIDDLHNQHFFSDLVINHAPGVNRQLYDAESYTKFLLGTDYVLLRPPFIEQAGKDRRIKGIHHALINFGGADPLNLTEYLLPVVLSFKQIDKVTVVTGSGYAHLKKLSATLARHGSRINHFHNVNGDMMADCMVAADLAIIPSSGILFEAIACKTPCISGHYIQNQSNIYLGLKEMRVFFDADQFSKSSVKIAIREALEGDPNQQIEFHKKCIDGKSPERYLKNFRQLLEI